MTRPEEGGGGERGGSRQGDPGWIEQTGSRGPAGLIGTGLEDEESKWALSLPMIYRVVHK